MFNVVDFFQQFSSFILAVTKQSGGMSSHSVQSGELFT